jgi:hypothetical protein
MADTLASLMITIDAAQAALAAQKLDEVTVAGGKTEEQFKKTESAGKGMLSGLQGIPASLQAIDARVDALRASVDPLAMAQKKANKEIAEAAGLYKLGAINADEYARYTAILEGRIEAAAAAQNAANLAHAKGAAAAKLTGAEMLNLSRQAADVGVSLAMGTSPLMVLVAQGPQIAETFQLAGQRGLSFAAVMRQIAVSTWAAVAPLLPFIAAAAAVGGTVAGGFALATQAINETGETTSELQRRLGLTSAEMKKLENDGVNLNVTMTDVFRGTLKVAGEEFGKLGDFIWGFIGGPLTQFGKVVAEMWVKAADAAVWYVRTVAGGIGGMIGGLKAAFASGSGWRRRGVGGQCGRPRRGGPAQSRHRLRQQVH